MTHFKYQVCLCCYMTSICEKTLLSVNLLLKFLGFFRVSGKFPGYFRVFSQGVGNFIPGPGILYPLYVTEHFLELEKERI